MFTGNSFPSYNNAKPFIWDNSGIAHDLAPNQPFYHATLLRISDSGTIAANSCGSCSSFALKEPTHDFEEITIPGFRRLIPLKVNNSGAVLLNGTLLDYGDQAVLWTRQETILIPPLPGDDYTVAGGMNNVGQVVGYSYPKSASNARSFIWTKSTGTQPLAELVTNIPSDQVSSGVAINDKGQIITRTHFLNPSRAISISDPIPLSGAPITASANGQSLLNGNRIIDPAMYAEKLSTGGLAVRGVSADGVAQVVIKIPTNSVGEAVQLRIKDGQCSVPWNTNQSPCVDSYGRLFDLSAQTEEIYTNTASSTSNSVTATSHATSDGPMAFVGYRAPSDFVRTDSAVGNIDARIGARVVVLTATYQTQAKQDINIFILRPPVMLVPGLWASADNWETTGDLLKLGINFANNPIFRVDAASYGSDEVPIYNASPSGLPDVVPGSSLGIEYGATRTQDQTRKLIKSFRLGKNPISLPVATVQADFVAHSMGSLITRRQQYLSTFISTDEYSRGYIHKVISLAGPHLGSPVALNLSQNDQQCTIGISAWDNLYVVKKYGESPSECLSLSDPSCKTGAIADLAGNGIGGQLSPALSLLQTAGRLPVAYIHGAITDQAVAALEGFPYSKTSSAPPDGYYYSFEDTPVIRRPETILDVLKGSCSGGGVPDMLHSTTFKQFMHGDSDGVVPVFSQVNGISSLIGRFMVIGVTHSRGTRTLGFGWIDERGSAGAPTMLDFNASDLALQLLNTHVTDSAFVKGQ